MASLVRQLPLTSSGVGAGTTEVLSVDATGFASGHTVVLGIYNRRTANVTLSSVTDSQGNSWTVGNDGHSSSTELVTATATLTHALGSGDTITLTWSATGVTNSAISIVEVSGVTGVVDANPAVTLHTGTTAITGPAVTTTGDDFIIGFFGSSSSVTLAAEYGWSVAGTQAQTGGPTRLDTIYIEEASAGTYTPEVDYNANSTAGRQATVALTGGGTTKTQEMDATQAQAATQTKTVQKTFNT